MTIPRYVDAAEHERVLGELERVKALLALEQTTRELAARTELVAAYEIAHGQSVQSATGETVAAVTLLRGKFDRVTAQLHEAKRLVSEALTAPGSSSEWKWRANAWLNGYTVPLIKP